MYTVVTITLTITGASLQYYIDLAKPKSEASVCILITKATNLKPLL